MYIANMIYNANISAASTIEYGPLKSELDSHANMMVMGIHSHVFDSVFEKTCDVQPFDPTIGMATKVPIVDAAIAYDCDIFKKTYILIARNVLHISSMENNLLPPFIMREAGVKVNDVPKIYISDPDNDDHSIVFPDEGVRIPLKLDGIFSYFNTRKPSLEEIDNCDKIFITPDGDIWNPYSKHFSENEDSMLDYQGNLIVPQREQHKIMEFADPLVLDMEVFEIACRKIAEEAFNSESVNREIDEKSCQCSRSSFEEAMENELEKSKFKMSIGSTTITGYELELFYEEDNINDSIFENHSTIGGKPSTVSADFLSKIWNIDVDLAKKALSQNTHLYRRNVNNDLSRHFNTNDRMLRYKRIEIQFFTDTFFVTGSAKSTRGHNCSQIFVSDKGYLAIYLMKSKSEFPDALHQFCKEVGVPTSIIVDPAREQTSHKVKKFCHQVGTTLRILEESTQWANRAELYIGLLKSAIRIDMRKTNSPIRLWDYCTERRAIIHNLTPRNIFQLGGNTPTIATFGVQGDISKVSQFDWYEWCYFLEDGAVMFPYPREQLGRCLGPLKNEGNEMAQAVLKSNGEVVPRRTVRRLTEHELISETEIAQKKIQSKY